MAFSERFATICFPPFGDGQLPGLIDSSGEIPQEADDLVPHQWNRRFRGGGAIKSQPAKDQLAEQIAELPARVESLKERIGKSLAGLTAAHRAYDKRQRILRKEEEEQAELERRFWISQ